MKFSEMMELAKLGYKPSEIAEMHKLQKDADPEVIEEEAPNTLEFVDETKDEQKEPEAQNQEPTPKQPEPNAELEEKYQEALNRIAEIQKANVQTNIKPTENSNDILAQAIRRFM